MPSSRCTLCRDKIQPDNSVQCSDCGLCFCADEPECTSQITTCDGCERSSCVDCADITYCAGNGAEGYCPYASKLCDDCVTKSTCQSSNALCCRVMCFDCAFDVRQDDKYTCFDCRPLRTIKKFKKYIHMNKCHVADRIIKKKGLVHFFSTMMQAVLVLFLFIAVVALAQQQNTAVRLRDVSSLIFQHGKFTNRVRNANAPQLACTNCIAGSSPLKEAYCTNSGMDLNGVIQWTCQGDDPSFKFDFPNAVRVTCEGAKYPGDEYVDISSCALEYRRYGASSMQKTVGIDQSAITLLICILIVAYVFAMGILVCVVINCRTRRNYLNSSIGINSSSLWDFYLWSSIMNNGHHHSNNNHSWSGNDSCSFGHGGSSAGFGGTTIL